MALASQASTSGRLCCSSTARQSQRGTYTALGRCFEGQAVSGRSFCLKNHATGAKIGSHACASHSSHQVPAGAWRHISHRSHSPIAVLVCSASAAAVGEAGPGLRYEHLLIALMDDNPYLSDGSKQVLATTASLATVNKSKVTVLLVDSKASTGEGKSWIETASWHLNEHGYDPGSAAFQEISLDSEETHNSSVVVGDAVDQVKADLVVLSAEAVHTKKVDCNLLAEFCTAPVLLLP